MCAHSGYMFTTCLFCHASLGSNDSMRTFPIGRRVAFDAERGRLWVVCRRCARWNLAPLEERWEAIEECVSLYERASRRTFTPHIALAHIATRFDLIRVGAASRHEFAAWRYGSKLRNRFRRAVVTYAVSYLVGLAATLAWRAVTLSTAALVGVAALCPLLFVLGRLDDHDREDEVIARVRPPDGHPREIRERDVGWLELKAPLADGGWSLTIGHRTGIIETRGAEAAQLASQLLAQLNREGGSRRQVDEAVKHLTTVRTAEEFIAQAARLHEERRRSGAVFSDSEFGALGLTATERLALEMAVNEDAERRAMEGELRPLEQAWRDAEEIASIADNLLVPDRVRSMLARLRSRRS